MKMLFVVMFCALALGTLAKLPNLDESGLPEDEELSAANGEADEKHDVNSLAPYEELSAANGEKDYVNSLAQYEVADWHPKDLKKQDAKPLDPCAAFSVALLAGLCTNAVTAAAKYAIKKICCRRRTPAGRGRRESREERRRRRRRRRRRQ